MDSYRRVGWHGRRTAARRDDGGLYAAPAVECDESRIDFRLQTRLPGQEGREFRRSTRDYARGKPVSVGLLGNTGRCLFRTGEPRNYA